MRKKLPAFCLFAFAAAASPTQAAEFKIVDVPSIGARSSTLDTIAFHELRADEAENPAGLIAFEAWTETQPLQKKFLSPYPDYVEPIVDITDDGVTRKKKEKLRMYVAEARFTLSRPPSEIDLARYANEGFLERLDPAIEHRPISAEEADSTANKHPGRAWCKDAGAICVASKYRLEGKLPMAVQLVKQLTDDDKLSEYLEFQSELRILKPAELDRDGLKQLTGIGMPVTGAIEQTIFYVNQIMKFGKFLAVFQENPDAAAETVVTAYIVLGLKARLLDQAKKYENVPILRNLVPAMVLTGKSSFNAGNSISAGLPVFARNNVKAVASILEGSRPSCPSNLTLEASGFPLGIEDAKPIQASLKSAELEPDLLQPCRPRLDPFPKSEACACAEPLLKRAAHASACAAKFGAAGLVAAPKACP